VTVKLLMRLLATGEFAHNRLSGQEIKVMEQDPAAGGSSGTDNKPTSPEDRSKVSATSMFDAVTATNPPVAPPVPAPVPEPPLIATSPSVQAGIPVVHEVVFPAAGAAASDSPSILSTLRNLAADEKVRAAELPPSSFVKSELPPAKSDAENSFVKSPSSAGFTQLLQALGENPDEPSATAPQIQTSAAPSQTPSSSAASFTRLLKALDADQASRPTAPITAPPINAQSTQPQAQNRYAMAESPTLIQPEVEPAKSAPPGAATTAIFQSPSISKAPASEPVEPPPPPAGSFTQLFQALDPKASDQPAQPAQLPASALPSADSPKSPGTFTQFFQAVEPAKPPASSPAPTVAAHQPAAPPPPAAGSFTQLFQAIDQGNSAVMPPTRPEPQAPATAAVSEPDSPGSFTQLFQAVASNANEPSPAAASKLFDPSPGLAPTHTTPPGGSFTDLFRAVDPATNPQPPTPVAQRLPSTMATAPVDNPEPQSRSSFTQIFRAIEGTPTPSGSPDPSPQNWGRVPQSQSSPIAPPYASPASEAPRSEGSNLTQLLRNLDQSASVEPPPAPSAKKPDAFTSLYGERQFPNPVERMQSASPAANVGQPPRPDFAGTPGRTESSDPAAGGASDFTRIIQASSLREQALKQGGQAAEAPKPAAPAVPATPLPSAPQIPGFPGAAPPQFPHPSVLPPLNFGQGNAMPPAQPFRAPNLAPPQWMPPAPQPPTPPAPAKAQPLLPLILIGVIFVLVVVLVAVIFLMKR